MKECWNSGQNNEWDHCKSVLFFLKNLIKIEQNGSKQ